MRKAIGIAVFSLLMAIAVGVQWYVVEAGQDNGQQIIETYGKRPGSRDQVKFHLALRLMLGNWNDEQKQIILKAINSPAKDLESEAASAFSRDDAKAVFYNIGSVDIADLRTVYATPIGKSAVATGWIDARKADLWRMNFALGFVRYDLSAEQQGFLVGLARALPMTREQSVEWEVRAVKLFTRDVGRGLFATIGDARCPGQFAALGKPRVLPQCVCTTKAGNWSCNDSCHGEGNCSVVTGDCGFLWLYDCNGMCDNSEA